MLRIIWLDLNRVVSMSDTTADMSALADACIDRTLNWLYHDCCQTMGTPYGTDIPDEEPVPQRMVVLGMGKLGARDLNLSSDIDLMFTVPLSRRNSGQQQSHHQSGVFHPPWAAFNQSAGRSGCRRFCLSRRYATTALWFQWRTGHEFRRHGTVLSRPGAGLGSVTPC